MSETDPLGNSTLSDLFSEMERTLASGRKLGEFGLNPIAALPAPRDNPIEGTEEDREQRIFEENFLECSFGPAIPGAIRQLGAEFKRQFDNAKAGVPFGQTDAVNRQRWNNMTLTGLAKRAENKFNQLKIESGRAIPNTPQHENLQKLTFRWEKIMEVVKAASQTPDQ